MQGPDADDAACTARPPEPVAPVLAENIGSLRIALAGGYFQKNLFPGSGRGRRPCRKGAGRDAHGRDSRSRARPRRRLCHHHHRRRFAASRSPAQTAQRFRSRGARPPDRGRDGAGRAGRSRAEIPPLVSCAIAGHLQIGRRADRAGHALRRAEDSARSISRSTASSFRCAPISASTPSRSPLSACRWSRCPCRFSRCRSGCRSSPPPWREDIALRVAYALERMGAVSAPPPRGL